ncbi:hypothetical protein pb186bvf_007204 [Paramecium bursaria]
MNQLCLSFKDDRNNIQSQNVSSFLPYTVQLLSPISCLDLLLYKYSYQFDGADNQWKYLIQQINYSGLHLIGQQFISIRSANFYQLKNLHLQSIIIKVESFASADRAFKVLAESDRGPVVIEYGSYCLGTYFDISIQYAPTVQIMKNFIRETVQKIQMGAKVEERSSGVHVPQQKFKVKRHLNIELLYRSAPSSPKGDQPVFKHSGFAAKKTFNQFTKNIPISQRSFMTIKPHKRSHINNVTHYEQTISRVQETKIYSRQDIMKMLHPNVEVNCPEIWSQITKIRSSGTSRRVKFIEEYINQIHQLFKKKNCYFNSHR